VEPSNDQDHADAAGDSVAGAGQQPHQREHARGDQQQEQDRLDRLAGQLNVDDGTHQSVPFWTVAVAVSREEFEGRTISPFSRRRRMSSMLIFVGSPMRMSVRAKGFQAACVSSSVSWPRWSWTTLDW